MNSQQLTYCQSANLPTDAIPSAPVTTNVPARLHGEPSLLFPTAGLLRSSNPT